VLSLFEHRQVPIIPAASHRFTENLTVPALPIGIKTNTMLPRRKRVADLVDKKNIHESLEQAIVDKQFIGLFQSDLGIVRRFYAELLIDI
jgi:hypothetical protein